MATRRRPKKKSSNNGVWIGSAISGGIILLICLALFMKTRPGPADDPSGEITEQNLAKQTLETDNLPDLGKAPGGSGSLATLITEANAVKNMLTAGGFEEEKPALAKKVVQALHGAAASKIAQGSLDSKIPPKYFDSPEMKKTFATVGTAVTRTIKTNLEDVEFDSAQGVAMSYLKLGQQIFEKNTRLKSRQRGLAMMQSALKRMRQINRARYDDGEIDEDERNAFDEKIKAWDSAIQAFNDSWNSKLATTETAVKNKPIPNIADIIKIANEDKDLTFRIWAARRLGYALYERGDQGNQEAIKAAIQALKNDSEKLVAEAAADGESINREEYAELRK